MNVTKYFFKLIYLSTFYWLLKINFFELPYIGILKVIEN